MRTYLSTPNLKLRLVALPGYSPDYNPDEAIWDWVREEVTANTCCGTATKVREKVDAFFVRLAARTAEVMQRCRRELQAQADQLLLISSQKSVEIDHVDLIMRSVSFLFVPRKEYPQQTIPPLPIPNPQSQLSNQKSNTPNSLSPCPNVFFSFGEGLGVRHLLLLHFFPIRMPNTHFPFTITYSSFILHYSSFQRDIIIRDVQSQPGQARFGHQLLHQLLLADENVQIVVLVGLAGDFKAFRPRRRERGGRALKEHQPEVERQQALFQLSIAAPFVPVIAA
jgi:hypothetical protein